MTNSTGHATETRVRIGRGVHVHRGNLDGNTYCGSQKRMGRRSGISLLPADTPVTCTKCGADAPAPAKAPVSVARSLCPNHGYAQQRYDDVCPVCDY